MDSWKSVMQRIAEGMPPLPNITSDPSEWHPLNGPPEYQEWSKAMIAAGAYAGSGVRGYTEPISEVDDGPV